MQTYKTILAIFVLLFVFGLGTGEVNSIIIGMLSSPLIGIYSIVMFLVGYRSWYLLWGLLASILGIFFFVMLLGALAAFT